MFQKENKFGNRFEKGHKITNTGRTRFKKGIIPWNIGKHLSEEHKRKVGEGNKGKVVSEETKKRISETSKKRGVGKWMKGKHPTLQTRMKMRLNSSHFWLNKKRPNISEKLRIANIGKKHPENSKENHPNWKGGTTLLVKQIRKHFKYRQWRSDIFTRDNYSCQHCNSVGYIETHHIKSFSLILEENNIKTLEDALNCEELWNINNGITLCMECHKLTDNYGNRKHR